MQARSNKYTGAVSYILISLGVIAIGLLIYVAVDRLTSPESSGVVQAPTVANATSSGNDASTGIAESTATPIGIRVGQRAPNFQLRSLDNENIALSDYRGQVVVLDFWASWCTPCKSTMPGLESMARTLAPDVVLVGVSLDQSATKASDYLSANNYDAIVALYGSYAAAVDVFNMYGGGGIPKTYVIDREGIIRYVGHPASLPRQTVERLI